MKRQTSYLAKTLSSRGYWAIGNSMAEAKRRLRGFGYRETDGAYAVWRIEPGCVVRVDDVFGYIHFAPKGKPPTMVWRSDSAELVQS